MQKPPSDRRKTPKPSVTDIDAKREATIIYHRAAVVETLLDEPKLNSRSVNEIDKIQYGLKRMRNRVKQDLEKEGIHIKNWEEKPKDSQFGTGFFFGVVTGIVLTCLLFQLLNERPSSTSLPPKKPLFDTPQSRR